MTDRVVLALQRALSLAVRRLRQTDALLSRRPPKRVRRRAYGEVVT